MLHAEKDLTAEIVKKLIRRDYRVDHIRLRSGDLDEIYAQYFEEAGDNDANSSGHDRAAAQSTRRKKH